MNPEAHKIVEELESLTKTAKASEAESQSWSRFIAWRAARLQVILAGEQAKSAEKVERQTNKLIGLTWAIVIFSFALFLLTAYLCYDAYRNHQNHNFTNQSTTEQR